MKLGYNTNGFSHHRLEDAIVILADLGYQSVAITLDYHALNPFDPDHRRKLTEVARLLRQHQLDCVIETGARFLLDPRRKHQPTLLDPEPGERERRLGFLRSAIGIAEELGAKAVSLWSGTPTSSEPEAVLLRRLVGGCRALIDVGSPVPLAFEPEPGMFIETIDQFAELNRQLDNGLRLTLDVGHVHCLGDGVIPDRIRQFKDVLTNVHIEDMRCGAHEHLMFGEGEIDFPRVFQAFREIGYAGGVHVELSRHGHNAVEAARKAHRFLSGLK